MAARARERARPAADRGSSGTARASPVARGSLPRPPTAARARRANGPQRRPILRGRRSRGRCEAAPRAETPQREQHARDRSLERADPCRDLSAEAELEILYASELVTLGEPPHVIATDPEVLHEHQRSPFEQIEGSFLGVRSTPSAEQLPRPIAHPDDEEGADVLAADARHQEVHAVAERFGQAGEVREVVDAETIALGHPAKEPVKTSEVGGPLGDDPLALGLTDVLPRLLAHRGEHRILILAEIHEEGAPRLHVDRRATNAARAQTRDQRVALGRLGIAEQAEHEAAAEDGP